MGCPDFFCCIYNKTLAVLKVHGVNQLGCIKISFIANSTPLLKDNCKTRAICFHMINGIGQAVLESSSFKVGSGDHSRGIPLPHKF